MKILLKNKLILGISLFFVFCISLSTFAFAANPTPTVAPCPDSRATGWDINSSQCVECQLFDRCPTTTTGSGSSQGGIDLTRFFPTISLNDIIGTVATILLAGIVIFFIFKVVLAGFKWVNNDAQDKSKKEAIKSITNGVIGIAITFAAYFIVIFTRSVFGLGGTEQLVNCSNIYFQYYGDSSKSTSFAASPEIFQRCIKLAGKEDVLNKAGNYTKMVGSVDTACMTQGKYFTISSNSTTGALNAVVNDRQKLNDCFIKELNNL